MNSTSCYKVSHISGFDQELKTISSALDSYCINRNDLLELILAIKYDRNHGRIPEKTHLKLVNLFCRSSGEIQNIIHGFRCIAPSNIAAGIELRSHLFSLTPQEFTNAIHNLSDDGYATLPFKLHRNICTQIINDTFNCDHSCILSNFESITRYSIPSLSALKQGTISAHMAEQQILSHPMVGQIVNDPVITSVVRSYLRTPTQLRHISLWHSFPAVNAQPETELAQLFHFDLDEFRWLKLFIFLNDVNSENGPHVYIPGTHKPMSKASDLLMRGYSRITDADMEIYHPRDTWREIHCEAGMMILADTRCWHKGTPVLKGTRIVLQPEYSFSTFSRQFL